MKRYTALAIIVTIVPVTGLATVCHEGAHVLAGWSAGGTPHLLTSTEVVGDFDTLSPGGFVALGASGSVMNLLFCLVGWWLLGRSRTMGPHLRLFAWFLFAVNGMLVVTAMMGESLVGFGDWMTILRPWPATGSLRILFAVLGTLGLIVMVRRSGSTLGTILPPGETSWRRAEAVRIVLIGAAASALLVLGGAAASPVGSTRGVLLALAAGLGPFVPIAFGLRFALRVDSRVADVPPSSGWPWLAATVVVVLLEWFVLGPGVDLTSLLA